MRGCFVSAGNWTGTRTSSAELPFEDPSVLAHSGAGNLARRIYSYVVDVQGPEGPLVSRQLQKHPGSRDRSEIEQTFAYWSPDGELRRVG